MSLHTMSVILYQTESFRCDGDRRSPNNNVLQVVENCIKFCPTARRLDVRF
jgi:hypothetical protein